MSDSLTEMATQYASAWSAEAMTRAAILERVWAPDGVYCDPLGRVEGRAALDQHMAGTLAIFPGHEIVVTSAVDEHHDQFRFEWELRGPEGNMTASGIDVGVLSANGQIASITGFFGPLTSN